MTCYPESRLTPSIGQAIPTEDYCEVLVPLADVARERLAKVQHTRFVIDDLDGLADILQVSRVIADRALQAFRGQPEGMVRTVLGDRGVAEHEHRVGHGRVVRQATEIVCLAKAWVRLVGEVDVEAGHEIALI